VDALSLFVSNAKSFFANLNDCAICYGVLAAEDRSLPSKKCPNGHWFHAICLYKVFISKTSLTGVSGSRVHMDPRVQLVFPRT
jgi:hypothetical protein